MSCRAFLYAIQFIFLQKKIKQQCQNICPYCFFVVFQPGYGRGRIIVFVSIWKTKGMTASGWRSPKPIFPGKRSSGGQKMISLWRMLIFPYPGHILQCCLRQVRPLLCKANGLRLSWWKVPIVRWLNSCNSWQLLIPSSGFGKGTCGFRPRKSGKIVLCRRMNRYIMNMAIPINRSRCWMVLNYMKQVFGVKECGWP